MNIFRKSEDKSETDCYANTKVIQQKNWKIKLILLICCSFSNCMQPAYGEGSVNLYPNGISGRRANLEWKNSRYGPSSPVDNSLLRRTLLQVYAKQGEYILLGSSAMGVKDSTGTKQGDILIYDNKGGRIGNETLSSPTFQCSNQTTKTANILQGKITSRDQELAGSDTILNENIATPGSQVKYNGKNGYIPCFYKVPTTGLYYIAFHGPGGSLTTDDGAVAGDVALTDTKNFNDRQGGSVAAWDVTVRTSLTSTTNIDGRLFADYLALHAGGNGRPLQSTFYVVTKDGYKYKTSLQGLDPNGFLIYGNDVGYYDSDGKTPLYHDVLSSSGQSTSDINQLRKLDGGTNFALPTHKIFFSNPNISGANETISYLGILPPIPPAIDVNPNNPNDPINPKFEGKAGDNNSPLGTGGTFKFSTNTTGIYEIIISQDGIDFDPGNVNNRVLRGVMPTSGLQIINWDGKNNVGNDYAIGTNYKFKISIHGGEYHFPLIDAENSTNGGPSFELINAIGVNKNRGYYDDRGYRTLSGVNVGTPNGELCPGQTNVPIPIYSDFINGFDTTGNQRKFGSATGGNAQVPCQGAFGDVKGLDIWTYVTSQIVQNSLNIIPDKPDLIITKTHSGDFNRQKTGIYILDVKNVGGNNSNGKVTVTDNVPIGLKPTKVEGEGWNCSISGQDVICTREDALAFNQIYPSISITVDVDITAADEIINTGKVEGGGETNTQNNTADDKTNIIPSLNPLSPQVSKIIINEVLYNQTGDNPDNNDEFIEIYNPSDSNVDLSGWKLMDGNIRNSSNDDINSITGSSTPYTFPNGTILKPGEYAVIWIGNNNVSHQAQKATFQAWLGQAPKLNNTGDDVWLYDSQTRIVDYIAYGNNTNITEINTPPDPSLNIWDSTDQTALNTAKIGQSISLTKNGLDENTSACWEPTTSGNAKTQGCTNYLPTRNTSNLPIYLTSVGVNNNGAGKLVLVKRITAINGQSTNGFVNFANFVNDPNTQDDDDPHWLPGYLKGAIDGGIVKAGDDIEYTIYFLSTGDSPVRNVTICDLVPDNNIFEANIFNEKTPKDGGLATADSGIELSIGNFSVYLTNTNDSDRGEFLSPHITAPGVCNKEAFSQGNPPPPLSGDKNSNGAIIVKVVRESTTLPEATPGSPNYGFIRFHAKIK
jgi:uncharacterized repeat protein (TIGR01451 family)